MKKLCGLGRYTVDERFEGAAFAAFVRSPHAHARVVSVDAGDAAAMPGVVQVMTRQDCAALKNFPVIDRIGKGLTIPFRPVLASDVVRHPGEAVACVIAETPAQALDVAEAVLVEYEILPAAIGFVEGAPLVHSGAPGNIALRHEAGDAAARTDGRDGAGDAQSGICLRVSCGGGRRR